MWRSPLSKWILCCLILSSFIICTYGHPQNNSKTNIVRRGVEDDVIEYKRTNKTRTTTTTPTSTSTPTAIPTLEAYTEPWFEAVYGSKSGITSQMMGLGIVLIVLGLYLCVMGFRLFKYSAAVIGLLTFGSMTWIALSNLQPVNGYINNAITMLLVPIGLGLIGSIVYFVVLTVALYASCAFGGFALAVFICSWASNLVIVHEAGRGSFLGGLALLLAIVTYFAADQMVLFATSFIGAYATILGVDCLARTGFIAGFQTILNNNPVKQIEYELNKYTYVLLAVTLVLFLIAMVIQMLLNKGRTLVLYEIKTQPVDDETGHSKYAPSTAKEATPAPAAEEKDAPPEEHPKSPAPTHAA